MTFECEGVHRSKWLIVTTVWPRLVLRISALGVTWKHCPSPPVLHLTPSASVSRTLGQVAGPQRWLEKWCGHGPASMVFRVMVLNQLWCELGKSGDSSRVFPFHYHFSQEHTRPGTALSSGLRHHATLNNEYLGGQPRPLSKVPSCISEEWYILCEMLIFTSLRSAKKRKKINLNGSHSLSIKEKSPIWAVKKILLLLFFKQQQKSAKWW